MGGRRASRGPGDLIGAPGAERAAAAAARDGATGADDDPNALDLATIRALRAGELDPEAAWRDLIGRHRKRLFSVAYRFTGSYEEAEELSHEIVVHLYQRLDRFDPRAHFVVWLNSVARNFCIDRYRARARERQRLRPQAVELERWAADPAPDPGRTLELREARRHLADALESLSPRLREAFQLRFLHELSYDEISERLGVPGGTVKSRIHRGRAGVMRHFRNARKAPVRSRRTDDKQERR